MRQNVLFASFTVQPQKSKFRYITDNVARAVSWIMCDVLWLKEINVRK